jgi:hypothetical protein
MEQKVSGLQRIITADESIKQKINTAKCLVSILWLVNEIDSLLDVPKWTTYNTIFFTDVVWSSLIENV